VLDVITLTPNDWRQWRELRLAALAEAPAVFGSTLADWTGEGDTEDRWRARLSSVRSTRSSPATAHRQEWSARRQSMMAAQSN
jgi:hypothetical protein